MATRLSDKETVKRSSAVRRNKFPTRFQRRKLRRAEVIETIAGILNADQTARLLENALATFRPYIAIDAFAALRRAELERLD